MTRVCKVPKPVTVAGDKVSTLGWWFVTVVVFLTVTQTASAVITHCPTNRTVIASSNCATTLGDFTGELESSDPAAVASMTQNPVAGTVVGLGEHPVLFTVTDTNGSADTCTAVITVVDLTPPQLTCAPNKSVGCAEAWTFDQPVATDACGSSTITVLGTLTNAACGITYVATRTWRATDGSGNFSDCSQAVTVVDTMPPVIVCPANRTVECTSPWSFGTPVAADNCLTSVPVYDNTLHDLATRFDPGTNEVGNEIILAGQARYLQEFSFEFWSTNLTGSLSLEGTNVTVRLRFYANDGPNFNGYPTPGTLLYDNGEFWLGMATTPRSTVRYDEFDLGLFALQPLASALPDSFTWTVQFSGLGVNDRLGVDLYSPPAIGNTYRDYWLLTNGGWQLWTNPAALLEFAAKAKASTNQVAITILSTTTNATCGNTFIATRTWRATDACGNSSDGTQVVTVVDTTPPVITCVGNKTVECAAAWMFDQPGATDACGTNTITVLSTVTNGFGGGRFVHTRAWRAVDACGNNVTCTQTVTVVDSTAPVVLTCATNVTLIAGPNCTAVIPDLTGLITATDCSAYSITQSPAADSMLGVGVYVLTFSIRDVASNATACAGTLIVAPPIGSETNISISEFMAKNTTFADENGTFSDWIEVHNAGPCPLNLNGWSLTDDATKLTKWRFPATNIAAGQFMLVWASDKNRRIPGGPLHSNFKLGDEGEYLALVRADGVTIATQFSPTFPPQLPDVSYGLPSDRATNSTLAWPTPGAPNSPGTNFVVGNLTFNPARGWFTNSVSVSISTLTAGATIYCTTNGTVPSPTNGFVYTAGLVFSNTTVLRAVAYRLGYLPSPPDGHSYIFPDQVAGQTGAGFPTTWGYMTNGNNVRVPVPAAYTLSPIILNDLQSSNLFHAALLSVPTLSVVMATDDMFGTNGIYSNTFGDGVDWERPCSVEYFRADSTPGFQINCGIRIQGGVSRDAAETSKHKLRLLFKQIYGAPFLVYDLYPGSPVNEFATLSLNATFQDHWRQYGARAQMQRDQWARDTQNEMGGLGPHGTYVNLYINGLYWGLYDAGDRPDGSYGAHYFGGQKSEYDAFSGPDELADGSWDAWNVMMAIANAGITNEIAYTNLTRYLDIPTFIDYLLMNFYAANQDWPDNNWRAVGSVQKGVPFHFFNWDTEVTFYGMTWDSTAINYGAPGVLYAALRQYPEFRRLFGDHAQHLLFNGGALTPQRCADRWMQRAQEIDPAILAESARWGNVGFGIFTKADWLEEQNVLLTEWFPQRTDVLIAQLRNAGMYPALEAPVFSPFGGMIPGSLTITMSAPAGTIYYTTDGSDPRMPNGDLSADAFAFDTGLVLTNSGTLRARAFATNTWSALVEADYLLANVLQLTVRSLTRHDDGTVELEFTAPPGKNYVLSASTNLIDWENLTTLTPSADGTFSYVDQAAGVWPARFYRLNRP